jgi:hypothetical protein
MTRKSTVPSVYETGSARRGLAILTMPDATMALPPTVVQIVP